MHQRLSLPNSSTDKTMGAAALPESKDDATTASSSSSSPRLSLSVHFARLPESNSPATSASGLNTSSLSGLHEGRDSPCCEAYTVESEWVQLRDGVSVYTETWLPKSTLCISAAVVFVHGLGAHSGSHASVFAALASAGIIVHSWDQRGWGLSAAEANESHKKHWPTAHIGCRDTVISDVDEAITRAKKHNMPTFLYGHSMGGLMVLDYASSGSCRLNGVSGVISTSPALGVPPQMAPGFLLYWSARIMASILPALKLPANINIDALSHCVQAREEVRTDPLFINKLSLSTGKYILLQGPELLLNPGVPEDLPILILHGSDDIITDPQASKTYAERLAKHLDFTLHMYEGYLHNLQCEPDIKDDLIQTITEWVLQRANNTILPAVNTENAPSEDTKTSIQT